MKEIFRDREHLIAFAYLCKRLTFGDAYRCSHGETEEERKAMAYRILEATNDIEKYLF